MSRTFKMRLSKCRQEVLGLILCAAILGSGRVLHAVTFTVPISTVGVTFVPGGTTFMPSLNVLAYDPTALVAQPGEAVFRSPGESVELQVEATARDMHAEDITGHPDTRYESENVAVATVTSGGMISAVGPGHTFVRILFRSMEITIPVRVAPELAIQSLEPVLNLEELDEFIPEIRPKSSADLSPGGSVRMDVLARFSDGSMRVFSGNSSIQYVSEDVSVATVDARGVIHSVDFGTTRIRVESHGVSTFTVVRVASPDTTPPATELRLTPDPFVTTSGVVMVSTQTVIELPVMDRLVGEAITSGLDFTGHTTNSTLANLRDFSAYYTLFGTIPFSLEEGTHTLRFGSIDKAGNAELIRSTTVFVDGTAPVTQLVAQKSNFPLSSPATIVSGTTLSLTAFDPVSGGITSGLTTTYFLIDVQPTTCPGGKPADVPTTSFDPGTCENPAYAGPFALSLGPHIIFFASRDNVGNAEPYQSVAVTVTSQFPGGDTNFPGPSVVLNRSSTTIELFWDPNGNPQGTSYRVIQSVKG